jgi:Tol biopolymer transport system component
MVDVKLALEELKEESDSGKLQAAVPRRRPRTAPWVIAGLAVAVVLAATPVVWWLTRQPVPPGAPVLTQLTRDTGLTTDPALSSDGKLLACASDRSGEGNLDIYVQQVGGGAPLRLTRDPADEREPAFSPDGTTIAFRSEKDGGGIYIASTLGGGPARLVAPGGRRPRFSPDGTWVTYWAGVLAGASLSIRDSARVFVVAAAGGTPRPLAPDFVTALWPIWSSDGSHVLFLGNRDGKSIEQSLDWWVAPLEGGPAVKTGALDATRAERLSGGLQVYPWALAPGAWEPESQSVLFSTRAGDTTNLWRIGISARTWKVAGRPERVTSGPALEDSPSLASGPGGTVRVAFASMRQNLSIWSLRIDPNEGTVTGPVRRWTNEDADDFFPALSSDGTRLVFVSTRTGHQELWVRNLQTGEDVALTASRTAKYNPSFSPDGTLVGFTGAPKWDTYVMPSAGGTPKVVCDGCGQLTGWSSDGKRVLTNNSGGWLTLLDLPTGRTTKPVERPGHWLCCGRFSPDDRWVSFWDGTENRGYVAPVRSDGVVGEKEWIDVIVEDSGLWSPDGTLIYGASFRDGYMCIWAQRLNPTTKRPKGAPFAVFHFHNAHLSIANQTEFGMSIGRDQLVFNMGERTGNIWMAEWKAR